MPRYARWRDDLAADATSGLSPYLRFGCVSPGEVAERARSLGGEEFVRQPVLARLLTSCRPPIRRSRTRRGWMHNPARLVTGPFRTKHLGIDWRAGAEHFLEHLVDGDVASNSGNWQWVAGTGADSRPYRMLSPHRQAERFDPHGVYVRRYVTEYETEYETEDYPEPIVAHEHAVARFRGNFEQLELQPETAS